MWLYEAAASWLKNYLSSVADDTAANSDFYPSLQQINLQDDSPLGSENVFTLSSILNAIVREYISSLEK